MIIGFRSEDETRVKNAERKSSMNVRMDRRKRQRERKSKSSQKTGTITKQYLIGGFGIGCEPENIDFIFSNVQITFVSDTDIPEFILSSVYGSVRDPKHGTHVSFRCKYVVFIIFNKCFENSVDMKRSIHLQQKILLFTFNSNFKVVFLRI